MAAEVLADLGLFTDEESSQLRLLDPHNDHSTTLRDHCKKFLSQMENFNEISDKFLQISDKLSAQVDQERMKAMGSRNRLLLVDHEKERRRLQMEQLLLERKVQLERLRAHANSLRAAKEEIQQMLDRAQG